MINNLFSILLKFIQLKFKKKKKEKIFFSFFVYLSGINFYFHHFFTLISRWKSLTNDQNYRNSFKRTKTVTCKLVKDKRNKNIYWEPKLNKVNILRTKNHIYPYFKIRIWNFTYGYSSPLLEQLFFFLSPGNLNKKF